MDTKVKEFLSVGGTEVGANELLLVEPLSKAKKFFKYWIYYFSFNICALFSSSSDSKRGEYLVVSEGQMMRKFHIEPTRLICSLNNWNISGDFSYFNVLFDYCFD